MEDFMREADVDGNGKLDYDEFVKMMLEHWCNGSNQSKWENYSLHEKANRQNILNGCWSLSMIEEPWKTFLIYHFYIIFQKV